MANIASAKKRIRQERRRTLRNNKIKFQIRHSIRKFLEDVDAADFDSMQNSFKNAIKVIDKAASKGVIHKNVAARKKSSLYKSLPKTNTAD